MLEERERPPYRADDDKGVARLREVQDGERLRGLAGRRRDRRDAPLERREAALEDVGRGVHEARVDVSELAQAEEARGVLRPVEDVRRRRVDRHGPRVRGGVGGLLRGVHGEGPGVVAGFRFGGGRHGLLPLVHLLRSSRSCRHKKNRPSRVRGPVGESDERVLPVRLDSRGLGRLCPRPREAAVRLPQGSAGHRTHGHANSNRSDLDVTGRVQADGGGAVRHVRATLETSDQLVKRINS